MARTFHICPVSSLTQANVSDAAGCLPSPKAQSKETSGEDCDPDQPASSPSSGSSPARSSAARGPETAEAQVLFDKVASQGEVVRRLKAEKASKVRVAVCVRVDFHTIDCFLS